MLTEIFTALCDHLRSLSLPLFLADCVPQGMALPYITADIRPSLQAGTAGSLILTCWCAEGKSNVQRLTLSNQLEAAIPYRGLFLPVGAGGLVITHGGEVQCVTERDAHGIVFRFRLQCIPTGKGGTP